MPRVSLGVILAGDPEYVQKPNIFVKTLGGICKYGFISGGIGIIASFIMMFADDWTYAYTMFRWVLVGILLFLSSQFIWDERYRCQYCKHFYCLRRISSNKFVDSSESSISRTKYDTYDGVLFDSQGNSTLFSSIGRSREYGTEITRRYTYNVRCRCCGAVSKIETHKTATKY